MKERAAPERAGAAGMGGARRAAPDGRRRDPERQAGGASFGQRRDEPADQARLAAEVARLEAELGAMRMRLKELEDAAERDPLTDLLNRRGFLRELGRAIAYVGRYPACAVLIYLDLDGFKPVNDRHGHAAGDAVLKSVASGLTRQVRASDAIGRLGGDEFALLLWNLTEQDAGAKALALEAAVAHTSVPWDGQRLSAAASAGMTLLRPDDTPAAAIARADAAMYARKRARDR
jgi:diguanylate cyclase (GGDEF)-like protein